MSNERIAIVGIGLRHPDASSPNELWENVLAGRLTVADPTPRLAFDAAAAALADAGFPDGDGLPRHRTGVVLGDSPENEVASRICTQFDLAGGGYTVDGGRSSALLSVVTAAKSLLDGDLDVAVAGGSRGVVVLMREPDAIARRHRIYASITGWGVASDGERALTRAYERAGYDVDTVSYLDDELIKTALAVHHQVIPPGTSRSDAALWPADLPVRAGVSALGVHLAIEEAPGRERRGAVSRWTRALVAGRQDADLLLVDAHSAAELRTRLARLAGLVATLSSAELTDVAGTLAIQRRGGAFRAAVVAVDPTDAAAKLTRIADELAAGRTTLHSPDGAFLAHRPGPPRIVFLFPGQGSDRSGSAIGSRFAAAEQDSGHAGSAIGRRFAVAGRILASVPECAGGEVARPWVVAGSVAGLRVLHTLGIDADVAVGHGLGELTALSWAGALDGGDLLRLATVRREVLARTGAVDALAGRLGEFALGRPRRPVVSTVTGEPLPALRALLTVEPVSFAAAAAKAVDGADLVIEVGPGRVLTELVASMAPGTPVLALDTGSPSLTPLLAVAAAAFALGADVDPTALFADRVVRPITEDEEPAFLAGAHSAPAPELATSRGLSAEPAADGATLRVLRRLTAQRAELPLASVTARTHPLDDLHLSPFTVGQIVNDATRELGLGPTANHAVVTLGELAELIEDGADAATEVPGYASWVRPFAVTYVPADRPPLGIGTGSPGRWSLHAPARHPLAERLRAALVGAGVGDGVLLCLPDDGAAHVALFLRAAQQATRARPGTRFVLVQRDFGAAGLARTLHLEHPSIRTTVIGLPDTAPRGPQAVEAAVARVVGDVAATTSFTEVRYPPAGTRTVPVLRALPGLGPDGPPPDTSPLGPGDVLLATGGATGIEAACALALARDSGARLALIGPAEEADLAHISAAGVQVRYERADVTSAGEVRRAVESLAAALGPVTAILHGAGRGEPHALANLTGEQLRGSLAPAVDGLRAVLAAVGEDRVRLLITFAGLRGGARHATAGDWLGELTVDFGHRHPDARVLALGWSVRESATPVSLDDGIAVLRRVLADPAAGPALVVSGRAAGLPTVQLDRAELPVTRFVDRVLVHYPGIELVTETELSAERDPYLTDHALDGEQRFPATFAMEAMAQVAVALRGATGTPVLEEVEFLRPIVVEEGGSTTVRLVALARNAETVAVAIRAGGTGFATDHVRARLRFAPTGPLTRPAAVSTVLPEVPVDPVAELYGDVLFQGKRFQRLLSCRKVSARHVVAELSTTGQAAWYAPPLPQEQVLADPGTRDAVLHAIQCCVPDTTLLPHGVERLHPADPADPAPGVVVVDARERAREGDSYTYDVDVLTTFGDLVERWEGLTLRTVRGRGGAGPWVAPLLGPYLERATEAVLGGTRAVVVEPDPLTGPLEAADRRAQTELAASRALGRRAGVRWRPDGRPEVDGVSVSAAHGAGLTLVVTGTGRLAADLEVVADRTEEDWATLLGARQLPVRDLVAGRGEPTAVAATRVWSVLECLRAAGLPVGAVSLDTVTPDGWVVFAQGGSRIATWATAVDGAPGPVVFAVLADEER